MWTLPLLVQGSGEDIYYLLVEFRDDLRELLDHHLRGDLKLVDHPVYLVYEQKRPDTLLQGLPYDRLGLGHDPFHGAAEYENSIKGPHGPCDVTAEVDVTGRIDKIYQIVAAVEAVDHGCIGRIDGDSPGRLLLVEIEEPLLSSQLLGHHARSGNQVVGECGLAVINVRCGADVPYELGPVHQDHCLLDVVLFSAHVIPPSSAGGLSHPLYLLFLRHRERSHITLGGEHYLIRKALSYRLLVL